MGAHTPVSGIFLVLYMCICNIMYRSRNRNILIKIWPTECDKSRWCVAVGSEEALGGKTLHSTERKSFGVIILKYKEKYWNHCITLFLWREKMKTVTIEVLYKSRSKESWLLIFIEQIHFMIETFKICGFSLNVKLLNWIFDAQIISKLFFSLRVFLLAPGNSHVKWQMGRFSWSRLHWCKYDTFIAKYDMISWLVQQYISFGLAHAPG